MISTGILVRLGILVIGLVRGGCGIYCGILMKMAMLSRNGRFRGFVIGLNSKFERRVASGILVSKISSGISCKMIICDSCKV